MPLEITENYIRIRQENPGKYQKKRKGILSAEKGIYCIYGILSDGSTEIQSYLFDIDKWTVAEAKAWVKENGGKVPAGKFVDTRETQEFVQRVRLCEMAEAELLAYIPQAALEAIRAQDEHPCFVAWEVGKTGYSKGRLGSVGSVRKYWGPEIVQELANAGNARPVIQIGHTKGGNRPRTVGEILRGITKKIGNAVKALWIGYISDKNAARAVREERLPRCSVEGMVDVEEKNGEFVIRGIPRMDALALAEPHDTPGFEHSGVLAVVQETPDKERDMADELNIRTVKKFIEDNKIKPEQIFLKEELLAVSHVKDAVAAEVNEQTEGLTLEKVLAMKNKAAEEAKTLKTEAETAKSELKTLKTAEVAKTVIDKALKHKGLFGVPKAIAALIASTLPVEKIAEAKDAAAQDAALETELKAAIDRAKKAGVEFPDGKAGGEGTSEADVESKTDGGKKDLTKPENNDLIPKAE